MKFINILATAVTLFTVVSCASVSAPEGGPKDETPPTLVSSNPTHQSLNVSTNIISLEFDEEVQPNNLTKELLITPNISTRYNVVSKRNRLDLVFEKPLEDSTTYTFNFRKGIVDITEKNQAEGLLLIFSTGNFIDSSRVSGNVVDLMRQTPEKEAVVALFPTSDTLTIRKNRPYYQATTDEEGNFAFENVKEGEYRIYALMDKNNNSFYDNESEKIAYLNKPIMVTPQEQNVKLQTVRIDTKRPILSKRDRYTDRFIANYNEGISRFTARAETGQDTLIHKVQEDGRAIEIYGSRTFTGGRAILTAIDSAGNTAQDTIQILFEGKRAQKIRGARLKPRTLTSSTNYRTGQPVTLELETPVNISAGAPIRLLADSVEIKAYQYPEEITVDQTTTELTVVLPAVNVNRGTNFAFTLDSTAIVPVQGNRLSFQNVPVTIAEAKGTGSIRGTIETLYTSYFLQLLNDKFQVVQQLRTPANKRFEFRNLEPGTYTIRVLIDENNDGKWNEPDPDLVREPEKVHLHPKTFDVRANWDMADEKIEF
ncbi:Ig-like domain-containing protein [Pontibacter sp. SGAir0037]|uniref:Ig-like domain-containing protein n=1 Tax=Pontibacter sp. SGAir0037 TaxID=2571030 RepID=UPI0010CCBDB9|nr:Ig-like domain-containing protein [Pontibacter sp. SGAir0037]QCR23992.1 hypothetical protein C1N53_17640 [Pontibacter sp. SGAir0037]